MNVNRLRLPLAAMALIITGLIGLCARSFAQNAADGMVSSMKTKTGSVTYILIPRNGFEIDFFSKEAGEPSDMAGVIQRCATTKQHLVFAMNGAKCDKSLKPLGLLIKGLTKHKDFVWPDKNVFSPMEPSAVFAIDHDNGAYVISAKNFKPANDLATYRMAIQSGTALITKSFFNPSITRAASQQVCNGIGVKANGDVVFAITNDKMSLRDFAMFFQELNCKDAMLLDEGANCQWYAPGRPKSPAKVGEILVVTKK